MEGEVSETSAVSNMDLLSWMATAAGIVRDTPGMFGHSATSVDALLLAVQDCNLKHSL